jgi:2'-5' RNA ligase
MPRLFIGIHINDPVDIADLQNDLKKKLRKSSIKWVEPENFHLTLKFLGDVNLHLTGPIAQVLRSRAQIYSPFEIEPDGLGIFGNITTPRVIWYGFRENSMLTTLQQGIEESMSGLGFAREQRNFSPHLTIGRIKYLAERETLHLALTNQKDQKNNYRIDEFQLIQSTLKKEGPVYTNIESFHLQA